MEKLEFFIPLFIFLGIFIILFFSFSAIFILQRVAVNKQYKLMEKFNYFNDNPIASNLRPISYLVEKNSELQPLLDYFDNLNKTYKQQMEEIKLQLFNLTKFNKQFHIFKTWKYMKLIEKNLDIIKNEENSFKILNLDTYSYTDNTSNISVLLSTIVSKLNAFLRDNNLRSQFFQSNDSLKITTAKIEKITKEINDKLMTINVYKTHETFLNALMQIEELYLLTFDYYYIYRYQLLVKSLTSTFKQTINDNKAYIVSSNIKKQINETIKVTKDNFNISNQSLWSKKLDATKKTLSEQIININQCILDILSNAKYQKLLDKTFNDFKKHILVFINKYNSLEIKKIYEKIASDFIDDGDINDILLKCTEDMKAILKEIESFKKALESKKIHAKQSIENINNIYKKIINFLDINEQLHDLLIKKTGDYFDAVVCIDNCLITLNFFLSFIQDNNIKNKEAEIDINKNIATLKKHQTTLKTTKLVTRTVSNDINNAQIFIDKIHDELANFLMLKELSKKLMLYFNRYIEQEHDVIDACSQWIKEGKYKEAIDAYILLGNKLKKNKKRGN